jgi:hypothetical protein
MVRFGAKKVEAIPPFLFSTPFPIRPIALVFLTFINNRAQLNTLTHLREFRLKAYIKNQRLAYIWRTIA